MVGDNDAGGVSTYAQAGQDYHTSLLWTLLLLIPVLVVNQEMVVRLGAVTGVGHARLINERFGRGWGWFSVGDLFVLNFLTIVTEFIGISLAASYAGISEYVAVSRPRPWRWWRSWPPGASADGSGPCSRSSPSAWCRSPCSSSPIRNGAPSARTSSSPSIYGGPSSAAVLLIIAIVGTTVAPWQLFFQQSNIVDKRITPRFISYERADTVIGSIVVVAGRGGHHGDRQLRGPRHRAPSGTSPTPPGSPTCSARRGNGLGALFAILLFDASIIGAAAVTLSTSYAFGDVFGIRHSLHRGFKEAKQFYLSYTAMVVRRRRHRAHPGRPPRPHHHQRPGPGRPAAAVGQRVPPAAVQRPARCSGRGSTPNGSTGWPP